jgi:predicted dehydrogenase
LSPDIVRIAVIGAGRWGSNLARVFAAVERSTVHAVCDVDPARLALDPLAGVAKRSTELGPLLRDPRLTAVAIATPPQAHVGQALAALEAGKHVFVEKPMALSLSDALRMRDAAAHANRRLMVGHLLRYHPAIVELRRLIEGGVLGEVESAIGLRRGPTVVTSEEGPWWALGPHDLSLLPYLCRGDVLSVRAERKVAPNGGTEVVAKVRLTTGSGELHVSSGDDAKMRRLVVAGTERTAVFDDGGSAPALTLVDVRAADAEGVRRLAASPRAEWGCGQVPVPFRDDEPLLREAAHFVAAVLDGRRIPTDADEGCRVVAALEAGATSMNAGGRWMRVSTGTVTAARTLSSGAY